MAFPSSLPSYNTPTSTETLAQGGHTALHVQEEADITAIATKMGTGASTPTSGLFLRGNGVGISTWDSVHGATDISGVIPTSNYDTIGMLKLVYPVGCIYTETTGVNPNTTFGFGTWAQTGQGRVLVGQGTSDQAFVAGASGGESSHLLSSTEMPSHTHTVTDPGHSHAFLSGGNRARIISPDLAAANASTLTGSTFGISDVNNNQSATTGITNVNTGGGATHNNLQPYLVVYFWTRTA